MTKTDRGCAYFGAGVMADNQSAFVGLVSNKPLEMDLRMKKFLIGMDHLRHQLLAGYKTCKGKRDLRRQIS